MACLNASSALSHAAPVGGFNILSLCMGVPNKRSPLPSHASVFSIGSKAPRCTSKLCLVSGVSSLAGYISRDNASAGPIVTPALYDILASAHLASLADQRDNLEFDDRPDFARPTSGL